MNVPGTQVSAAEAVNGETITFTTPEQVMELRRRVHAMASMHNEKHADGSSHGGMMGGGMMSGGMMGGDKAMDGMKMPPSRATVFDLELGASVTVIPVDPDDLQKLRSAVRMHVQHMQKNGCAMMEHGHGG
jgi:alanine dehydrogenase